MKNLFKSLGKVIEDIRRGENIDAYIAILLGLSFSLLGILGITGFDLLGAAILLTITFLVFGSLANRRSIEKFGNSIDELKSQRKILSTMKLPDESLREKFRNAKNISIIGLSLLNTLNTFRDDINECLSNGGSLRVIILDPNGPGIDGAVYRSSNRLSKDQYIREVNSALDYLDVWRNNSNDSNIKIKLIAHLPSYAITLVEPKSEDERAHCHVRLWSFRKTSLKGPIINPDQGDDKYWFDYFAEQYEEFWQASTERD